ncbi:uncharacterized protein STEHIDRAFT_117624 [Stereum hirsutum FP-91666 SS1]|uniref:uncharacterized protein n=1 Tax=Stereum hirsutum (strain FP-91666) TaxID=721885 RepID=UPI000440A943|nr:uncharacterized protein STEHIDRAFT_117624 [Stereum hirsutum FP-91666 SS1]EIM92640.1 hypothetical protein STEHIDRAFT_117624 [Stereum hirsutum FP-91666 SS1]
MSLTLQQVAAHNNASSCWVIIANKVYDVTDFLPDHPGGRKVILQYAGRDATSVYEPLHPPDALEKNIPPEKHLGSLTQDAQNTISEQNKKKKKTVDEERVERAQREKPKIERMLSLRDIEHVARKVLSHKALAYYSSATDDEITYNENERAFSRFFFNARVLRAVSRCNTSTTILGFSSSIPVFVCGAALAKLGHPLGEACITIGAHKTGIIQMISSNASLSSGEISAARPSPSQVLFFQLYKNKDNSIAEKRVKEIESQGYKAIFLTVDAVVASNRERDLRAPFELEDMEKAGLQGTTEGEKPRQIGDATAEEEQIQEGKETEFGGTAGSLLNNDDVDMTWEETIPWLRSVTKLPIVLKGIQCVEDAVRAAEAGVDGILISNHGGRQLEYSLPSMEVLYRLHKQRPDIFSKMEVYLDGGVRRGTDVLKALCLGAKAVGMGRPFLYALSAYGEAGVVKTVHILERELVAGMRLLGVSSLQELTPEMVERVDWQPVSAKL